MTVRLNVDKVSKFTIPLGRQFHTLTIRSAKKLARTLLLLSFLNNFVIMTSEIPQTRDSCKKVIAQNNDDQTNMYTNTD